MASMNPIEKLAALVVEHGDIYDGVAPSLWVSYDTENGTTHEWDIEALCNVGRLNVAARRASLDEAAQVCVDHIEDTLRRQALEQAGG